MTRHYIIEIEEIPLEQQQPDILSNEGRIVYHSSGERLYRAVGIP